MPAISIGEVVEQIEQRRDRYRIGQLQHLRRDLKGGKQAAATSLFRPQTIFEDRGYAYHYGGRTELQFNIGIEREEALRDSSNPAPHGLRHGVAFSLEPSPTLHNPVAMLSGQIERFNDYVRSRPESLSGFEMWDYTNAGRSSNRQPIPINDRLVKRNNFIFLGSLQPFETLDYERLMADWDRLLPLFEFVLARDDRALPTSKHPAFKQFSGRNIDLSSTQVARSAQTGVVDLAHNRLLAQLKHELAGEFGETNVLVEVSSGNGGTIDAVVVDGNSHIFYELKITASPQDCLRQAIGQLLEYAYWPGAGSANALVVVGEAALDAEGDRYLATLRERFSLPLTYRRIVKD